MYYIYVYCHNILFSVCPLFFIIILTLFLLVSLCYLFWPDDLWVYSALLRWSGHDLWLLVNVTFSVRSRLEDTQKWSRFLCLLFLWSFLFYFFEWIQHFIRVKAFLKPISFYLYLFSVCFSLISYFVWTMSPSSFLAELSWGII